MGEVPASHYLDVLVLLGVAEDDVLELHVDLLGDQLEELGGGCYVLGVETLGLLLEYAVLVSEKESHSYYYMGIDGVVAPLSVLFNLFYGYCVLL